MKIFNIKKAQSNTSQFMHGEIPEYSAGFIGSPNVDTSQIASIFPNVNKSVNLVNKFDSRYLHNITFIFNSSDQGSYGVYVPALDRSAKEKVLKKKLEGKGYKINSEGETLVADDPKGEKQQDEIQKDIESLWKELEGYGGSVFGVNMSKDLDAARNNARIAKSNYPEDVVKLLESAMSSVTGSSSMEDFFCIVEVGSTIVHEATQTTGRFLRVV